MTCRLEPDDFERNQAVGPKYSKEVNMNWEQIAGKWNLMKGSIKQKWGKLTDDDLAFIAGSRDKFLGRLQERYGLRKEEAEKQIEEWSSTVPPALCFSSAPTSLTFQPARSRWPPR
jgi:uncharacterized protein YjbJ (UPF0337 family)